MSSSTKIVPAFFGATGGCLLETLTRSLKAGYECNALARTPSKLTKLLLENGVPQEILDSKLHIVQGDVRDAATVQKNLIHNDRVVDIILSGVGATSFSETNQKGLDICQVAMKNIFQSLNELKSAGQLDHKPLLVSISSTGITEGKTPRDLPILWIPAYKYLLANPHKDKIDMEKIIEDHMDKKENERLIRGYVIPRSACLTNGPALGSGPKGLRCGLEDKPAIGYTVRRADVGLWIFEHVVEGTDREGFVNHKPSLAY